MAFEPVLAWDLYGASGSELDPDGFLLIQPDHYGEKNGGGPSAEVHHPYGFASRPLDPEVDADGNLGKRCNVFVAWEGGQAHVIVGSDPRITPILPPLKKGESVFYGARGQFVRCKEDGSVAIYTTADGSLTGQTVSLSVAPGTIEMFAPWGTVKFNPTGFHVVTASGATLEMGGIGGMPSPFDALGNWAKLSGAMVQIEGSVISLGTTAGVSEPAAKATSLVTYLTAIEAIVLALATAVDAKLPTSAGVNVGVVTAALAAIQALKVSMTSTATSTT